MCVFLYFRPKHFWVPHSRTSLIFHWSYPWKSHFLRYRRLHEGVHVCRRQPVQPAVCPGVLQQLSEELLPCVTWGHAICATGAPSTGYMLNVYICMGSFVLNVLTGMLKLTPCPHGCFAFHLWPYFRSTYWIFCLNCSAGLKYEDPTLFSL